MVSSLYMATGVLYCLLTMLLIGPSSPLVCSGCCCCCCGCCDVGKGLAAWLCPLPMCWAGCGVAASEVLVTGVMFPGRDGEGDGIDPVGVTDGLQAVPLEMESSKEFPAAMMTSCASL